MVEFPLAGGAIPSYDLNVLRLRRYMTDDDYRLIILESAAIFFLMLHMWSEWRQVMRFACLPRHCCTGWPNIGCVHVIDRH